MINFEHLKLLIYILFQINFSKLVILILYYGLEEVYIESKLQAIFIQITLACLFPQVAPKPIKMILSLMQNNP